MRLTTLSLLATLLLACLLTACTAQSPDASGVPAPSLASTPSPIGEGAHTLILQSGSVAVRRAGWQSSIPGRFGMVLRGGDLLDVATDARALVVCADLTVAPLAPGPGGVPCRATPPVLFAGESRVQPARTAAANAPLLLVSPRQSLLLNTRPSIRWSGDPAAEYEVLVSGPGVSWSRRVAGTTLLTYPTGEPALAPGSDYLIEVRSGGASTEDEQTAGRGFTLITGEERAAVEADLARVAGLALDEPSARVIAARILLARQLYADALEELRGIAQADSEPELLLLTGDIYLATGLPRLAEQQYLSADERAAARGDEEVRALASRKLGVVYAEVLGNAAVARSRYEQAARAYQQLGDTAALAEVEAILAQLK